jgi:putative transposase
MSVIGSRYAYYFNKAYKRTVTIWEGRHKSSLIQSDRYFPSCCRYIELSPVVAGIVTKPEEHKWSSYHANAWGREMGLVPHVEYLKLGKSDEARCRAYRELVKNRLPGTDVHLIERASDFCSPVGDDRFCQQIEAKYGIKLGYSARGRPKNDSGVVVKEPNAYASYARYYKVQIA